MITFFLQSVTEMTDYSFAYYRYANQPQMSVQTPTCQSVVNSIVSGPKPQDSRRQRVHLIHTLPRHVLEVPGTWPAAEEAADIASHRSQHLLGIWRGITGHQLSVNAKSHRFPALNE